ncbi:ABC transporter permease [Candidatus Viridilinea mediisalina]|uniref:Peptide ABC transporter permease n=1 Tax=Candidatus Viridilinea mediisalina TaxID=2024553 RepID=A0A2A6RLZ8_9CHLR|nr:ABC transporter permease [Candidatus Viridilinea mediisalina]PDW03921.1 peptide ABC transporter permease [Candidatus Viridilinea mediisalina]
MIAFLLRRVLLLIVTLFVVSAVIFAISELAPGNIAINVLGNTITPEQEASFNAQHGLDQPALDRYLRWMIGSDWQAARLIGAPLDRIVESAELNRTGWWAIAEDGTPFRHRSDDGETMLRLDRQPDGTTVEVPLGPEVWQTNEDGIDVFWGVDTGGRAAMWVRGSDQASWVLTMAGWTSQAGAPRAYIPLQKGILRGDFGVSIITKRPVAETLIPRLINTLFLAGIAFVLIMPIALAAGIIAGLNQGRPIDRVLSVSSLVATSTPEFASGVFLILIFAVWLGWFPGAVVLPSGVSIFDRPQALVLPVLTLTLIELGYVLRVTRASMVEVMQTNYIRTAILKGLPYRRIVLRHALRNALLAPITVIMLHVNWLIGGIVVVEALFGFPGLGRFILDAALTKDVFAIEAAAMVLVVIAVTTQLIADLIYVYLNPRIRFT